MTEESTPTPTERGHYVRANMPWGDTINLDVDGNWWRLGLEPLTLDEVAMYGPLLRLSSPAEVAELVQTTSQRVWKEGALWSAVEVGAIRSIHDAWLVPDDNPYSKPTTDTTEESHE